MRIAIVGSGIAGLGTAWLLSQRHDIAVYEIDGRVGGHSHTVDVPCPEGTVPVDTGFIVYNERNYPNLCALFDHLDVTTDASDMSFGVSIDNGRLEYAGNDAYGTLFAQKRNLLRPTFHRMLIDIMRFNSAGTRFLAANEASDNPTLGDFLKRGRYGKAFASYYLLPMGAAIWSATLDRMNDFPARSLLQFFANHGLLSLNDRPAWRTVQGGSRAYVDKLTAPFRDTLRPSVGVKNLSRHSDGVLVTDTNGGTERFDQVVLACHANSALALIDAPHRNEQEILAAFDYQSNRAVLHKDPSLMPKRRAVWSSWNYLTSGTRSAEVNVSVTYWLNKLQNVMSETPILVTLNPLVEPDPASIVGTYHYDHPQFNTAAIAAQKRLFEIQGRDRLWFCGAHWGYGFHEDGLTSGLQVAAALGVTPPWWSNVEPLHPVPFEPEASTAMAAAD